MKKNITLLIQNKEYLRSWIETDQIKFLRSKYNLKILIADTILFDENKIQVEIIKYPRIVPSKIERYVFWIQWAGNYKTSSSFKYKFKVDFLGLIHWNVDKKTNRKILKSVLKFLLSKPYIAFMPLLQLSKVRNSLIAIARSALNRRINGLGEFFPENQDIVLIPSSSGEANLFLWLEFFKKNKVTSILCVDNWDNLTSKASLACLPDFVTVMGPSSVTSACKIHGFTQNQVLPFGLPRFDPYRNVSSNKNYSKKKISILYLGFSLPHNEINLLNRIYKHFGNFQNSIEIELRYRPHTARIPRYREEQIDKNIKVSNSISLAKNSPTGLPPMDSSFFEDLISADLIIGTPTTMLLEAMMLKKICILDLTNDGIHRTTAAKAFENYLHMRDLNFIDHLGKAYSFEGLIECLEPIILGKNKYQEYDLSNLVNLKRETYFQQLVDFIDSGLK